MPTTLSRFDNVLYLAPSQIERVGREQPFLRPRNRAELPLEINHPKSKEEWVKIFKKTFKFTGGEIVNEFLMSIGYLLGAHSESCKIYDLILKTEPMWMKEQFKN